MTDKDNSSIMEESKCQLYHKDHRNIGLEQELYFFHEMSPGCCFFLPKGAHIFNKLIEFMKSEYSKRGFMEVVTPNIYNSKLWASFGYWQHYSKNMFHFEVEKEMYALKTMNCPGHCLLFNHTPRSWKELPIRFAEFGVLHRTELSRSVSGLNRLHRFQQDDAHIFCMPEQVKQEIESTLDFMKHIYGVLDLNFHLALSTRPEIYLGGKAMWNEAENLLAEILEGFGEKWEYNDGEGALYGPKIDITVMDVHGGKHQCATIQLDYQLPIKLDLQFISSKDGTLNRPVMIHRAILGSIERMFGILTENYSGKWPFWLTPRQCIILPAGASIIEYGLKIQRELCETGIQCDLDGDTTLNIDDKIKNAKTESYYFILVVGEDEEVNNTAKVYTKDSELHMNWTLTIIKQMLNDLSEIK